MLKEENDGLRQEIARLRRSVARQSAIRQSVVVRRSFVGDASSPQAPDDRVQQLQRENVELVNRIDRLQKDSKTLQVRQQVRQKRASMAPRSSFDRTNGKVMEMHKVEAQQLFKVANSLHEHHEFENEAAFEQRRQALQEQLASKEQTLVAVRDDMNVLKEQREQIKQETEEIDRANEALDKAIEDARRLYAEERELSAKLQMDLDMANQKLANMAHTKGVVQLDPVGTSERQSSDPALTTHEQPDETDQCGDDTDSLREQDFPLLANCDPDLQHDCRAAERRLQNLRQELKSYDHWELRLQVMELAYERHRLEEEVQKIEATGVLEVEQLRERCAAERSALTEAEAKEEELLKERASANAALGAALRRPPERRTAEVRAVLMNRWLAESHMGLLAAITVEWHRLCTFQKDSHRPSEEALRPETFQAGDAIIANLAGAWRGKGGESLEVAASGAVKFPGGLSAKLFHHRGYSLALDYNDGDGKDDDFVFGTLSDDRTSIEWPGGNWKRCAEEAAPGRQAGIEREPSARSLKDFSNSRSPGRTTQHLVATLAMEAMKLRADFKAHRQDKKAADVGAAVMGVRRFAAAAKRREHSNTAAAGSSGLDEPLRGPRATGDKNPAVAGQLLFQRPTQKRSSRTDN
eukprot:TRINITY_DN6537_c0_g1_i1.p1 TRINITY_DN6537_c0_g1~~TRINITY_DN6537_c0_g1_i1.p1  ORF type:complete len:639 (-),score=177.25 TRINITY_DN6537_c0_g1_i1:184-2100(-)